ncbi:MAG: AAA family ATPase [Muribaculaceae bacterium]|nr:AAA family ATPase [Muribaculaceae bacterium]
MFEDLRALVAPIKDKIQLFRGIDCTLPEEFKKRLTNLGKDTIKYGTYAAVITNADNQHIYISNNWFYIAAILSPLFKPFEAYRKAVNEIVSKDILKNKNNEQITAAINTSTKFNEQDKLNLIKFATDYSWWTANSTEYGKSLDRNDCLTSAVLAIANVVNNSQSYIAAIWNYFGNNPDIVQLLVNDIDQHVAEKKICVTDKNLREFIYKVFKVLEEDDHLRSFQPYAEESPSRMQSELSTIIKLASNSFSESLVDLFIEASIEEINRRNNVNTTSRWFTTPFNFNGRQVYLSNQWTESGNYQLTLKDFKKYLSVCYNDNYIITKSSNGVFELIKIAEHFSLVTPCSVDYRRQDSSLQVVYFGAPGTSKSTTIKNIIGNATQHRITFHPDTDYSNFVGCYKPTKEEGSEEITYAFVEQSFIKAYVDAWKKLVDDSDKQKEVYLIIEEINRGNCAQIFGDLFQLLDRDDKGYSDYTIEPDSDLQRHLAKMFKGTNVPENIRNGVEMQLPPNMFIWATMNTSDQSLFPIDSAFKRRWEWKYLPIKDDHKGHIIRVDEQHAYDWWLFLEAINLRIEKLTELEDKQLGYWFAKPNKGKEISVERFVSKVVFYLWNDVFKDYGNDGNSPFNIKQSDDKRLKLKFTSFFDPEGNVMPDKVITFIEALGVPVNTGAAAPLTEGQQIPPDEQNEASGEPEATPDEQPEALEQHVVEEPPVAYGPNQPASSPEPDDDDDDDDDEPEDEGGDMNDLLNELYLQK